MNSKTTVDEIITKEIAARAIKMANADYATAEAAYQDAEFKCNKLRQFRQDYQDRFNDEMKAFIPDHVHQGFRSFFLRLDAVIMEQQDIVEDRKQQCTIKRQLLQETKNRQLKLYAPTWQEDYALI